MKHHKNLPITYCLLAIGLLISSCTLYESGVTVEDLSDDPSACITNCPISPDTDLLRLTIEGPDPVVIPPNYKCLDNQFKPYGAYSLASGTAPDVFLTCLINFSALCQTGPDYVNSNHKIQMRVYSITDTANATPLYEQENFICQKGRSNLFLNLARPELRDSSGLVQSSYNVELTLVITVDGQDASTNRAKRSFRIQIPGES